MKITSFNILKEELKQELTTMDPFYGALDSNVPKDNLIFQWSETAEFLPLPLLNFFSTSSSSTSPPLFHSCFPCRRHRNPPSYLLSSYPHNTAPCFPRGTGNSASPSGPVLEFHSLISNRKEQIKWMEYKHELCLNTYNWSDFLCAIVFEISDLS